MRLLLALLACGLAWPALAEIYRWTDADGRVHYGERPPPEGARRIDLPAAAGAVDDEAAQRRARQQRLLESFEHTREQRRAGAVRDAAERDQAARRCEELKRRWQRLSHAGPVYFRRADGGRDFLDDAQRAAELARMRPAYREACGAEP